MNQTIPFGKRTLAAASVIIVILKAFHATVRAAGKPARLCFHSSFIITDFVVFCKGFFHVFPPI
ncbi:MAG: hypothetical protein QM689_00930 [Oscillospiraceae bacterium]